MEWFVDLIGENQDLEELSKSLTSEKLCISKGDQGFILKSESFKLLQDQNAVLNKAKELIAYLNGAARMVLGMRKSITIGGVNRLNENGAKDIFICLEDAIHIHSRVGAVVVSVGKDGQVHEFHQADIIPDWIAITEKNENVAKVLRLFGVGSYDWVDLYRIYEIIGDDMGGSNNIVNKQWATKKTIVRFTHTANSPDASGDRSRHGKGESAPKDPMTIAEAKSFVENIIHNWIRSKIP